MAEKLIAGLTDGSEHQVAIPADSSPAEMLTKLTGHMKGADWVEVEEGGRIRTAAVITLRIVPAMKEPPAEG